MLTLKEMVINILTEEGNPLIVKSIANKLVQNYPEKLESKTIQKNGDKKLALDQIKAEISSLSVENDSLFFRDKSSKPVLVGIVDENEEKLEIESLNEDFESDSGIVYILGTNTFTKDAKELVKIGLTTLRVEERIKSLYTSGVPFEFRVLREYKTSSYSELEKAMHKLLNKYRPNPAREFFTSDCLDFADEIFELHKRIELD
jgi:hypothetical protein